MKMPKKISRTAVIIYCIILLGFFIYGFVTISKNCYNSMHSDKMIVFEADSEGLTIMNHRFRF